MSPEAAAEEGLYRRLTGDAPLVALLGAGQRIFPDWPADTLTAAGCPRITFYTFGPAPRRPGFQRVRLSLDLWVWPSGVSGGRAKLLAIDEQLLALFDEQHWSHGGHRLYSTAGAFRDFPAPPDAPLRRLREITIDTAVPD